MSLFNREATFIKSATKLEQCPDSIIPEVCFAGRSNVGKSSLINALVNRNNLARTSNVPGKTQEMNYYSIGDLIYLVDLPGYGYAKISKTERERWGRTIHEYLLERKQLKLILQVVDARHKPTALDQDLMYWMGTNKMTFCILMSKSDKLSNNKLAKSKQEVKKVLEEMNIEVPILAFSSTSKRGIEEVKELISEFTIG